jgi:hypothetical protein
VLASRPWHVVGELRRRRARPSRVGRREDLVVADRLEQPERRLELASVSPQNPTITSVEIAMPGTASRIRVEPLEVVLDRVLAAIRRSTAVVAGLDRQMQVLAHDRQSASAATSRSDSPTGATVTKRSRGMAARPSALRRPSIARISSARSGRPWRSSLRPAQRSASTCAKRGSAAGRGRNC